MKKKVSPVRAFQLRQFKRGLCAKCSERRMPRRNLCERHLRLDSIAALKRYYRKKQGIVQPDEPVQ